MNVRLTDDQKIKLHASGDVYKIMQQILLRENKIRRNQEHFWVIGLNNKNKILFIELVSLGAVNRQLVAAPEVFRMAIYKLAVNMILVHNHPSGEPFPPSDSDTDLTDRLMKAGKFLNIAVHDHLIISETDYFSYADAGIIRQLRENGFYELVEKEEGELRQMKIEMEKKAAVKENKIEIAKNLKAEGMDADFIKKVTGLPKREIDKL